MRTTDPPDTIDLPAGTIHYRVSGPEDGRPVVFVHGFLVDDTLWADVPERLAEAGFRDLRAHLAAGVARRRRCGRTPSSARARVARIILSFLEALDLHDVILVGNDTGGAVCQFLLDEDASRIGRLVLTNCDAFDTFPPFPFNLLFRLRPAPGGLQDRAPADALVRARQRPARLRPADEATDHRRRRPSAGCGPPSPRRRYAATPPGSCAAGRPPTSPTSPPGCTGSTGRC